MDSPSRLTEGILAGHTSSIARMISRIESERDGSAQEVAQLHAASGRAHVVGITGPAGAGKSTLVAALARELRKRGKSVGVIAVDPSSCFSGGSILGDRIRMNEMFSDPGIFFRSMATRGALGGLSRATANAVTVLDAAGMEYVLVETVGAGQVEIDIATTSHSVVVVSVPGLGDEIQTIKAGLLEIADIHVVNKADIAGANKAMGDLKRMLKMADHDRTAWNPPVLTVESTIGRGVPEFVEVLRAHRQWLTESNELQERERRFAATRIVTMVQSIVMERMWDPSAGGDFEALVDEVRTREQDPLSAARQLIKKILCEQEGL